MRKTTNTPTNEKQTRRIKPDKDEKEEPPQTVVRIINYTCKRNPQTQIIFGGAKEGTKENLAS